MILMFDSVGWFNDALRTLASGVDWLIYSLISWILEGIFNLSAITASTTLVNVIYKRVFTVLIIFMIFKLSFSFVQYLINPDAMMDKEKGVAKIISRSILMLAMLILVPILFFSTDLVGKNEPILTTLQNGVIRTLPKLILGVEETNSGNFSQSAADSGKMLASNMLNAFYYEKKCKDTNESSCGTQVQLGTFLSSVKAADGAEYQYYYMWPLTTIAGILIAFTLVGFAIDVAIRTFKMMILEMIAPVPIMSYIDPKASKDGAFSSWLKMLITTYIDIFIKLGSIYILLLLISKMFDFSSSGLFGSQLNKLSFMARNFVVAFLAWGLLKFIKDAPKFIKDALGIKDSGGGGGFMGKALAGAAGAAMGFAGGLATGGLAGGLSGITTGASAGFAGKAGQAFSQVRDEQAKLLGKTPGGIKGKIQNKAMQRSVMKHTGLDKNKLKDLKDAKIAADNELAIAEADYANGDISAQDLKDARKKAGTANSAYENANALAKQIGLKPGFMQENKRHGAVYAAARHVGDKVDNLPSTQWIKDRASDVSHLPSTIRHAYDTVKYHGSDNADTLQQEREIIKDDKKAYSDSLRGGVGADTGKGTRENLRQALKNDRQTYRDDKKDFKNNP